MAAIGDGWAEDAWIEASWETGAWKVHVAGQGGTLVVFRFDWIWDLYE